MDGSKTNEVSLHLPFPALGKVETLDPPDFSTSQEGGLKCNYWLCVFAANSENQLTKYVVADHASEECDKRLYMYKLISSSV